MQPHRILAHEGYNLRSTSRLSGKDDEWVALWLDGRHRLNLAYRTLRNQRVMHRKEFYETVFALDLLQDWLESAPPLLYELGAGHGLFGLLAAIMAPGRVREVVAVDRREPKSYSRIRERLVLSAPWLKARTRFQQAKLTHLPPLRRDAWVVAVHACGPLTDEVATAAAGRSLPFVVVPCCESVHCAAGGGERAPGLSLADRVNAHRVERWQSWGYTVEERALPERVTERARVFLCRPR